MRIWRQIDGGANAVPGNVIAPEPAATQRRMRLSKRNHAFDEPTDVTILFELTPIEPADFVILVVRIVVSELSIQELVACAKHRDAIREHEQAEEVFCLFPAQCQNLLRGAIISFMSAVPAEIRVRSVLICMAILPVVFVVVRNEVV